MIRYLFARYRKAIAGAAGAGLLALAGAYFIVSPGHITNAEWNAIILAIIGGAGGPVVTKPNAPKKAAKGQAGNVDVGPLLLVAILVFVLLLFFRVHA